MKRRLVLAAGAAALSSPAFVGAQSAWPSRGPVRLIAQFPPGGLVDTVARLMAPHMSQALGQTVVVENRPGAGGNLGLDLAARAAPDGYTLALGQTSNLAINPTLFPKMPYDVQRDFAPVALVSSQPTLLVVSAQARWKSLAELVVDGRADAGGLTMASAGSGTVGHLAGEMFAGRAGLRLVHVPYKGAAPALTDLIGGQVALFFASAGAVLPHLAAGKLRALAVTSLKRMTQLPAVPSIAESGWPDFEATDWKALVAPAGTPAPVVTRLNLLVNDALGQAAVRDKLMADGSVPLGGSAERLTAYLVSEQAKWGAIVRATGARVG